MTKAVSWLSNWLHGADPTIVWIVIGYLICIGLILVLMRAKAMADRKAERWAKQASIFEEQLIAGAIRQCQEAGSLGPRMTAETLGEEDLQ